MKASLQHRRRLSMLACYLVMVIPYDTLAAVRGRDYRLDRRRVRRRAQGDPYDPNIDYILEDVEQQLSDQFDEDAFRDYSDGDYGKSKSTSSRSCKEGKSKSKGGSCAPTMSPMPSDAPSVSAAPSSTPSLSPSASPSKSPTKAPTDSPSSSPTQAPTITRQPSPQPSPSPSSMPSSRPTLSYEETSEGAGGSLTTSCRVPPQDGVFRRETLAFQYNLYIVEGANIEEQVGIVEDRLHRGMSERFLSCDYETTATFHIVSLSSDPEDTVDEDEACDVSNDPEPAQDSICYVVTGAMMANIYFPQERRTLQTTTNASPEVKEATGDYFATSMSSGDFQGGEIVQTSFQGFIEDEGNSNGGRGNIAQITDNRTTNVTDSPVALGSVIVGMAILVLLLVLLVTSRRRTKQHSAYLKQLDQMSFSEVDTNESHETLGDGDRQVMWVKDAGEPNDSGSTSLSAILDMTGEISTRHDPRTCRSPSCPACRRDRNMNPTFVHSSHLGYSPTDLQRMRDLNRIRDAYRSPDTVEL